MRTTRPLAISLASCTAIAAAVCWSQPADGNQPKPPRLEVLRMKVVPDGNFLVNLQLNGQEHRLDFKVTGNLARCVNSTTERFKGLEGRFQLIGNGVFLVCFQNENHRASQFWVFREEGSAAVKEVPDRGEKQFAIPVENDSIEQPKKVR